MLLVLQCFPKNPTCAPQEILAEHGSGYSNYFVVGMLSSSLNVDNSAVNMYPERNDPHQSLSCLQKNAIVNKNFCQNKKLDVNTKMYSFHSASAGEQGSQTEFVIESILQY